MVADAPSPGPSPIPGPTLTCAVSNAPPHVLTLVRPVGAEQYLSEHHRSGVVDVKVYLAADGTVSKAVIARSSGDAYLDGATYDAAVATTYAPEIRDCQAVSGAYIYRTRYSDAPSGSPSPSPSPSLTPAPAPTPIPTPRPAPVSVVTNVPTTFPNHDRHHDRNDGADNRTDDVRDDHPDNRADDVRDDGARRGARCSPRSRAARRARRQRSGTASIPAGCRWRTNQCTIARNRSTRLRGFPDAREVMAVAREPYELGLRAPERRNKRKELLASGRSNSDNRARNVRSTAERRSRGRRASAISRRACGRRRPTSHRLRLRGTSRGRSRRLR
jgi:TonB family protein